MSENNKKDEKSLTFSEWGSTVIWLFVLALAFLRMSQHNEYGIYGYLTTFSNHTFSTLGSITVSKLYIFLKKDEYAAASVGLSRDNIEKTFLITVMYGAIMLMDTCINKLWVIVLYFVFSLFYIICFLYVFPKKSVHTIYGKKGGVENV